MLKGNIRSTFVKGRENTWVERSRGGVLKGSLRRRELFCLENCPPWRWHLTVLNDVFLYWNVQVGKPRYFWQKLCAYLSSGNTTNICLVGIAQRENLQQWFGIVDMSIKVCSWGECFQRFSTELFCCLVVEIYTGWYIFSVYHF